MKPIGVKVIRAEKRKRKIIIVIESDLYSDETFAVTPFYNEGDDKNQLQSVTFLLKVKEQGGVINAEVDFDNCLSHSTKGHRQLHKPIRKYFLTQKECALDYFMNEKQESYTHLDRILKLWESDKQFHDELLTISAKRKNQFKIDNLVEAKKAYQKAYEDLDKCIAELSF